MTEKSESGTFTYWKNNNDSNKKEDSSSSSNWKPPTEDTEMTYNQWIEKANITDDRLLKSDSTHYYFRMNGCAPGANDDNDDGDDNDNNNDVSNNNRDLSSCLALPSNTIKHAPYMVDELPFYSQAKSSLYIKDTVQPTTSGAGNGDHSHPTSKLIVCRFGMQGVIATNHFDGERNMVTVLSGERRYILSHPKNCGPHSLYPFGHPSARHSAVDWSDPDIITYPQFQNVTANEIVLQAGESLFIPSLWFHYIVSLSTNVQCNTRSGMDERNGHILDESCGW